MEYIQKKYSAQLGRKHNMVLHVAPIFKICLGVFLKKTKTVIMVLLVSHLNNVCVSSSQD